MSMFLRLGAITAALLLTLGLACGDEDNNGDNGSAINPTPSPNPSVEASTTPVPEPPSGTITLYSGRGQSLVGPLIEQFERDTGIDVEVRYGGSAEMAATIAEEGNATPADVFWSQDPGPAGALSDRFTVLREAMLEGVHEGFTSPEGRWVGVSGRARVIVYNTDVVEESEIPETLFGLTDPEWEGRVGWAPPNASFQVMVTALRAIAGEDAARQWLEDMQTNDVQFYGNNIQVLQAVNAGEVDVGLANHYYLHALKRSDPGFSVANHFPNNTSDAGSLIMVSAIGILSTTDNQPAAELFVSYLLSPAAQQYFATETTEYPVTGGTISPPGLPTLESLQGPVVDLADLNDIQGTLQLLRETGALP